jgi:hypothetical protein
MANGDKIRVRLGRHELELDEVKSIRFAVGSAGARRSSTWRVWGNKKGDFYFSTRTLGGIIKTSLHRDGRCHYGFTSDYVAKPDSLAPKDRSRLLDRWTLPDGPFCCAARILIPEAELRIFPPDDSDQMRWLAPPAAGGVFVVAVYVLRADAPGDGWPGADKGALPIGILTTRVRSVWVVGINQQMDAQTIAWLDDQRRRLAASMTIATAVGHRMVLSGARADDGTRWYLEIAWQQ